MRPRGFYRSQEMALWLNLIPDLQSAGRAAAAASEDDEAAANPADAADHSMLDYHLYTEMLPFVPQLKSLSANDLSTPSSSEVVLPNATQNGNGKVAKASNNTLLQ